MKSRRYSCFPRNIERSAFTLVEVLVVATVCAVLVGLGMGAINRSLEKGSMAREIAAGKNVITAYQLYASENNGSYLLAYHMDSSGVQNANGDLITESLTKARYPFRLAPYFNFKLEGTVLVNRNEKQIKNAASGFDYFLSAYPAFGINRYLVGGNLPRGGNIVSFANDCVTRQSQADASVIAFASAGAAQTDGYEYIMPPVFPIAQWSAAPWQEGVNPSRYGNVAPRYSGKAVCVFLDGSVRMHSIEELRDMRLWSRNAALQNDPNYMLPSPF